MKWIDGAIEQSKQVRKRREDIETYAPSVEQGLWNEVVSQLNSLRNEEPRFHMAGINGHANDRIVYKPSQCGGSRIELHIKLKADRTEISVSGANINEKFDIDVLPDGTVGLKHDGREEKYQEAAERILKPFFFPEIMTPKQ